MKICTLIPKQFPEKLLKIENPPKQLHYIGNINLLYEESFAVVGTRRITRYGIKNCKNFTKELALRNIPIVSGMAIGTDAIAHKTALNYKGKTIAVLGSGLERIFPTENYNLFEEIISNGGLVISEYENNIKAQSNQFLQRNRIVTAISEGVLVIEAGYRSGTSVTVKYAKKQGKHVFAIPGNLDNPFGIGVNRMIKEGAILTTCIEDILINYPQFMNRKWKEVSRIKREYKKIYGILEDGECTIDELLEKTKYNIKEIIKVLSSMELDNIVINEMGVYKINE